MIVVSHCTLGLCVSVTVSQKRVRVSQGSVATNSERELTFTFATCCRPSVCRLSSVCLSVCRLSVVCLSVTLVRPTQAVEIFRNISMAFGTLAIR